MILIMKPDPKVEALLARRDARLAALKAESDRLTREFWDKWRETSPLDSRREHLEADGIVNDPNNAAKVHPEELATAPHYKTMEEIRTVMDETRAATGNESQKLENAIAKFDKDIETETKAKEEAMREGKLEEFREHAKTLNELKDAREVADFRLHAEQVRLWSKLSPEETLALYESIVEVTRAKVNSYDKAIEKAERELRETRQKRAAWIEENNGLWFDFYRDVCHKPELYFKTSDGSYINTGSGIIPMKSTGGALYDALQELKSENGRK